MSNYGLDDDQRENDKPWGLPGSVLAPGKVVTDPVHGDIYLTKLEVAVIDSRPFQRLRRIRQLGNTHLVYPGAVHTRFSHCLGALKVVQTLLDVVWNQSAERRMGIRWELHRYLGGRPDQWPLRLAVAQVFKVDFESQVDKKIKRYEPELADLAARMPSGETFDTLCKEVELVKQMRRKGSIKP